jgi:hypothetical protein
LQSARQEVGNPFFVFHYQEAHVLLRIAADYESSPTAQKA